MSQAQGPGLLLSLEGGEGAGKTTQQGLLLNRLRGQGVRAISTREPGATALGVELRAMLMDLGKDIPSPQTELLLYLADRAQHVNEIIRPALQKGLVVVCDRFVDSSEVYQGRVRGLGVDEVRRMNRWLCGEVWPELTILLDVEPETGLKRILERQGRLGLGPDRLESESLAFHHAVREGFLAQAAGEPGRIKVVPANLPPLEVAGRIWELLEHKLQQWAPHAP